MLLRRFGFTKFEKNNKNNNNSVYKVLSKSAEQQFEDKKDFKKIKSKTV